MEQIILRGIKHHVQNNQLISPKKRFCICTTLQQCSFLNAEYSMYIPFSVPHSSHFLYIVIYFFIYGSWKEVEDCLRMSLCCCSGDLVIQVLDASFKVYTICFLGKLLGLKVNYSKSQIIGIQDSNSNFTLWLIPVTLLPEGPEYLRIFIPSS